MELPKDHNIAAGPVIVENGKILLNRTQKSFGVSEWMLPGGRVEPTDESFEAACKREAMEELNINVEITKEFNRHERIFRGEKWVMINFLATYSGEIKPGDGIVDWGWHDLNNLPEECAPSIYELASEYLEREKTNTL